MLVAGTRKCLHHLQTPDLPTTSLVSTPSLREEASAPPQGCGLFVLCAGKIRRRPRGACNGNGCSARNNASRPGGFFPSVSARSIGSACCSPSSDTPAAIGNC